MQDDLVSLLGVKLDEVGKSSFVTSLQEEPRTELIEDRFYMELPDSGLAFIAPLDGTVMTIQFHAEGHEGYKEYSGTLPGGVSFSDSRSEIYERLGKPSASGGGGEIPMFGKAPVWDRFDGDGYSLHLQYGEGEGSITLVTLMRPDSVPQ